MTMNSINSRPFRLPLIIYIFIYINIFMPFLFMLKNKKIKTLGRFRISDFQTFFFLCYLIYILYIIQRRRMPGIDLLLLYCLFSLFFGFYVFHKPSFRAFFQMKIKIREFLLFLFFCYFFPVLQLLTLRRIIMKDVVLWHFIYAIFFMAHLRFCRKGKGILVMDSLVSTFAFFLIYYR